MKISALSAAALLVVFASESRGESRGESIQSYRSWSIGMTREEALGTQRSEGIKFDEPTDGEWLRCSGGVPIPFMNDGRGRGKLNLKFVNERVGSMQIEFAEVSSIAAAVEPVRRAESYLRTLTGFQRNGAFENADLEKEIAEGIAKDSRDMYIYRFPEYSYLMIYIQKRERTYQCRISIHDDGSGGRQSSDDSNMTRAEPQGGRLEDWRVDLSGSSETQFQSRIASIHALLVSPIEGGGHAAAAMRLGVTALPTQRSGTLTVSFNQPVGEDMRRTSDEVFRCLYVRHGALPEKVHVEFAFADKWVGKDGPSAAVATALLVESLIRGFEIPSEVAVTGDLNADSTVQPVGGVADKIRGALEKGCTVIGIPAANEEDITDLVVEENLRRFLVGKVFTLETLDDALDLADPSSASDLRSHAVQDFHALQGELAEGGGALLFDPRTKERLQRILEGAPNLYSAKILLKASERSLPARYSLVGTLVRIDDAMSPFAAAISDIRGGGTLNSYRLGRGNPLQETRNSLAALKAKSDERLIPVIDAEAQVILQFQRLIDSNAGSTTVVNNLLGELRAASERSAAAWKTVRSDRAIQDQLMRRGIHLDSGD